jgi:hypothetical protein
MGKVVYTDHINDVNVFSVSMNKRIPYEYEKEYRALLIAQFKVDNSNEKTVRVPKYEVGVDVEIDLMKLIDKIYVSPFCGPWFRDLVKSALEGHLPTFDFENIIQSGIRDK